MSIPEVGKKIRVTVPSTTANLGPGFDCLGAALDYIMSLFLQELKVVEIDLI